MLFSCLLTILVLPLTASDAVSCPAQCDCSVKDAVRCLSPAITDIASLGLPRDVTYILISGTSATHLSDKCFREMTIVLRLLLESNQISVITPGTFSDLVELKTLKLTHNRLNSLPTGVFDKLIHLEQLFLDQNSLTHIEENLFTPLVNLKELLLNKNKLAMLSEGLFRSLTKLKVLNLSRNTLASLPQMIFSTLSSLEKLLLYDNKLRSIECEMFRNLEELVELSYFGNHMESIAPGSFDSLHKLQVLKLSKNKLQLLPWGLLLHMPNLTMLTIYENPLKELPEVLFGVMDMLKKLWIYKTQLYTVPDYVFSNLTKLELLVLTMNPRLSYLPSNAFSGLHSLLELSLHTNNLTTLEVDLFQGLQNLRIISLYRNNMKILPRNLLCSVVNLEKIYLNGTKLEMLPGHFFCMLPKLQEVHLYNNPWRCNCDIQELRDWVNIQLNIVWSPWSLICDQPLQFKNVSLLSTSHQCHFSTNATPIKSSSLGTISHQPSDQPGILTTTNFDGVQFATLTTATTSTIPKTTGGRMIQRSKHVASRSPAPISHSSSYYYLFTRRSTSHSEFYPTTPFGKTTHDKTGTTSGVHPNLNTNPETYHGSISMQHPWIPFHFKAPYSKILFYLHLPCLTGQFTAILVAICILYKINHLNHLHSFVLPVILLKISGTVEE
ncbi:platelet glycoprotein V [Pleurodeles waltl]|uniref:platelet glycoprotein V n=1 Tax=Pleurodeles waltl TaxID=8319 RepID=UPI003709BDAD